MITSLAGAAIAGRPAGDLMPNIQVALSVPTAAGAAILILGAFIAPAPLRGPGDGAPRRWPRPRASCRRSSGPTPSPAGRRPPAAPPLEQAA